MRWVGVHSRIRYCDWTMPMQTQDRSFSINVVSMSTICSVLIEIRSVALQITWHPVYMGQIELRALDIGRPRVYTAKQAAWFNLRQSTHFCALPRQFGMVWPRPSSEREVEIGVMALDAHSRARYCDWREPDAFTLQMPACPPLFRSHRN